MKQVATIRAIARYPVKSMRGEALPSASLGLQGIPGDREYAFVQAQSRSSFPWLTGRQLSDLLRYCPAYENGSSPPRLLVTTPAGLSLPVDSDDLRALLEEASGRPLFLLRDHRGSFDVAAVSLIGLATVARIAEESGVSPDPSRFRPNFLVESVDGHPYAEEGWVGGVLRLGETVRVAVTEPDERCAMITLDPCTAEARPEVLRVVAQRHGNRAGVYGTVLTTGSVQVRDPVYLE
jgi:uncharacterized protein YcbX